MSAESEELSDADDYLNPSAFQERLPLYALFAVAGMAVATFLGIILWLELSSDAVTDEMRAVRPQVNVRMLASARPGQDEPAEKDATHESAEKDTTPEPAAPRSSSKDRTPQIPKSAGAAPTVLHPHPDPQLVEKTDIGMLPVIGTDGRQPWRVYSRPFNALEKRPRVAIVIVGLGVSFNATESVVQDLPGEVTLAFEPFSSKLEEWIDAARGAGHEVLLNIPMEPRGYPRNDPGPFGLMTGLRPDENKRRLDWILSRMTGYVGVSNFQGDRFAGNKTALQPVLRELARRGLLFVDTVDQTASAITGIAPDIKLPLVVGSQTVDEVASRADIEHRLSVIETIAKKQGAAVVIAHPYPVSIRILKRWIGGLGEMGLALAPISAVANRQTLN